MNLVRIIPGILGLFLYFNTWAQDPNLMGPAESKILSQINNPVFRKNAGQYDPSVLFRMTSGQSSIAFYKHKIQFGLRKQGKIPMKNHQDMGSTAFAIWDLEFENMNEHCALLASEKLPTRFNQFTSPEGNARDIDEYGKLVYKNIYPNIDLVFYVDAQKKLKYDFIVNPGGDYAKIKLNYNGVKKVKVDKNGKLEIITPWGNRIKEDRPICWQLTPHGKVPVKINYQVQNKSLRYISSSPINPNYTLVIDPMMLDWSSYFYGKNKTGSSWGWTYVLDMDVDKYNKVYVVGMTSELYPIKVNTYDTTIGATAYEGFIAKMSLNADSIELFSYIGGNNWEYILSVAVNASAQPVISGITYSNDYPVTSNAYDNSTGTSSGYRGFITKFSSDFKSLVYSTYFGKAGAWNNVIQAMALTANGDVVFTGQTSANNLPVTSGCMQGTYGGGSYDAFLTRLSADGSKLIYSTYFGGTGADQAYDLSINANEDVYIVGSSSYSNFPVTVGAKIFKTSNSDAMDGFVAKIQKDGKKLLWSHLMGGTDIDVFEGLFVNGNDELYIGGYSKSSDFYTVNAIQPSNAGGYDHIVVKMNKAGTNVFYSTYLGGSGDEYFYSGGIWASNIRITANVKDEAIIGGITKSTNYPITSDALQKKNNATSTWTWATNLAITKIDYLGRNILYGTYFGGSYWEWPTVLKVKKIGCMSSILYGGITGSTDYPTTKGVYHEKGKTVGGSYSGFMSRFRDTLYTEPINFQADFIECDNVYEVLDAKNRGADFLWNDNSKKQLLIIQDTGTYWVRATYGCDTVTDTIRVKLQYSPKLNLNKDTILCNNTKGMVLDAENDTIIRKYLWSTGDTTQTILAKQPGLFKVKITTPHCGILEDSTKVQFLKSPDIVSITDSVFCDKVDWLIKTDSLGAGTKYLWSTKDTGLSTKINSVGTYQIKVSNYCGKDSVTFKTTLLYTPTTDLPKDTLICDNFLLKFKTGRKNNEEVYDWSDIKKQILFGGDDSLLVDKPCFLGISVKNRCGSVMDSMLIIQKLSPKLTLGKDSMYCDTILKYMTIGLAGNDETYLWNTNNQSNTQLVISPGMYWASIKNYCGEARDTITFIKKTSLSLDLGPDSVFCDNVSKLVDIAQNDPQTTYKWHNGSSVSFYNITKAEKIWANITNYCGTASDTILYSKLTSPTLNLGNDYVFCDNISPVNLTAGTANNQETYLWSDSKTTNSNQINKAGKHWLEIKNKCKTVSDTILITMINSPEVNLGEDTALCGVFSYTLDALNPGLSYLWLPYGENTQKIQATKQGVYEVTVTDQFGCFGKGKMEIKDDCKSIWYIPNIFTPNGDALNDDISPTLINCENYTFIIYNRWGEKLFETHNPSEKWNGTYLEKNLPDGYYLYTVNFKSAENKKYYNFKGGLMLMR